MQTARVLVSGSILKANRVVKHMCGCCAGWLLVNVETLFRSVSSRPSSALLTWASWAVLFGPVLFLV